MPATELKGVLPVIQTPFDADGEIDHDSLRSEISWVFDQGVAGVTTGMVSEILRLTETERMALSETVVGAAHARDGISVISCGAESTLTAVAYARHAESIGADAIMVNPPLTVQLDQVALLDYYSAIADATSVPFVVQDASGYVGAPLSLELQATLLDRYGLRVYFKPEASPIGPRLSMLRDITGGKARILEGTGGAALIDSSRRGVIGTMPGAEVCWAVQRLWDAIGRNDWATAYALSGTLNAMISMQSSIEVFVAVEKYLLVRQGVIPSAAVRSPSSFVLDHETAAEIDRLFDQLAATAGANPAALTMVE